MKCPCQSETASEPIDIGEVTLHGSVSFTFFLLFRVLEAAFLEHFLLNIEKLLETSDMMETSWGKKE